MADNTKRTAKGGAAGKKPGLLSQIRQIFAFTYADDKALPWLMALAVLVPTLAAVVIAALARFNALNWVCVISTGLMLGLLLATVTLTRRSDAVGYRRMEGKPGATGAILHSINKGGFNFPEEPVWIDMHTKDAVWRGSGRNGVFLVGEGEYGRVMKALDREEVKIRRITRGSAIPIHKISVGDGDRQVKLGKLRRQVTRQKVTLTKYELDQLNDRLNTLRHQSGMGIPKGMDPTRMHMNRRALRGR